MRGQAMHFDPADRSIVQPSWIPASILVRRMVSTGPGTPRHVTPDHGNGGRGRSACGVEVRGVFVSFSRA
jgi:hypothetical protein